MILKVLKVVLIVILLLGMLSYGLFFYPFSLTTASINPRI